MLGSAIAISIIVVVFLVILFTSYVKSPPDKAYIISGLRKTPKILIGKAGLKLPFFERKDELLDNLVYHLIYRLKNKQAAKHLLDCIDAIYD
ncbi:MAG: hypothetical protein PUA92_05790, partial [Clostridium sp.]|nr:hypothetical protein [Clostridium sp.]